MRAPGDKSTSVAAAGSVAEAMTRVLTAEREAREAIEAAREEAQRILEQARRDARSILEYAERTAREVHGRTDKVAAARAARLLEAAEAQPPCPDPGEVLDQALLGLAARLTGGADA